MIRKITTSDFVKAAEIWLHASLQAHNFIEADFWQKHMQTIQDDYLPNAETFVFEDKHKIKGFISIVDSKYIGGLFVAPTYQNKKIGSKLLEFVRKRYPHLCLKVYVKNLKALRFYQHKDFKIVSEGADEATQEKELLMSWALGCKSGFGKRYQGDS